MHKRFLLHASAVLLVLCTGCSAMFQGKINLSPVSGSLNDMFYDSSKPVVLQAPSQIFAAKGSSPVSITVSWNRVPGADSYVIQRAVVPANDQGTSQMPGDDEYEVLKKVFDTVSYTDTVIDGEPTYRNSEYKNRYYYRVIAFRGDDEGPVSQPDFGYLLGTSVSIAAGTGEEEEFIRVKWSRVPGASRYKIYRSRSNNGSGAEYLASIGSTDLKYDNKISVSEQGEEFYYYITALDSSGAEGVKSPLAMGFSLMSGAPPAPSITKVSRGIDPDKISIEFTSAVSSDPSVSYIIYRNSSEDSTLIKLGAPTGLSYTDKYDPAKELYFKPGVYYYYFVQAVKTENGRLLKSPFSASKDTQGKIINEGFMLSPPSEINVFSESNGIRFEWKPAIGSVSEQSKYAYKLSHSNASNSEFNDIITMDHTVSGEYLTYSYTMTDKDYKYFRLATTLGGKESIRSIVVEPSPLAARAVRVSRETIISGTQPDSYGVYPVKITWEAPETDAAGYHVLRSTSATGGFTRITTDPVTSLEYVDIYTGAKPGVYYYYRVLSLNSLGQGALYSDTAYGYGALTAEAFYREYVKTINSSHKKLTLMHKSSDMDKLGSESASGTRSGSLSYNASVAGLGARITMHYSNYADHAAPDGSTYLTISGDTNTSANMSANGTMDGTVTVTGMYNGSVVYNKIQIKGGAAGGGNYVVTTAGLPAAEVSWSIK